MLEILLIGLLVGSVAWLSSVLTARVRDYAVRSAMLDHANERSSHQGSVPRGGGLAIVLSFAIGVSALVVSGWLDLTLWLALLLACAALAWLGWRDDQYGLSATRRFAVHLLTAFAVVSLLAGGQPLPAVVAGWPPMVFVVAAVIALVWLLNLYNFMDGVDAIAGLQTLSMAVFLLFAAGMQQAWEGVVLALILAAAVAGFLRWNWPPARIFMGDVGSATLGLLLGILALAGESRWRVPLLAWVIMLSVFVTDATVTLLTRLITGQRWYAAHRSHAYQRLSRRWQSHRSVSLAVLVLNLVYVLPLALLCCRFPQFGWMLLAICYVPLIVLALSLGAGRTE